VKEIKKNKEAASKWAKEHGIDSIQPAESELGQSLKVLYTPADTDTVDYFEKIGFPGEYPFTRGIYPGMYRVRPWAMRLYAGFGTAEDTNKRWKFLLQSGNNGVGCAFDLPTQMGLDSDNPEAQDEVGKVGLAVDTLRDFEILYQDLSLDQIVTSFNINAPAAIILALYIASGEKQGLKPDQLRGTLANDILCEYVSRGMWVFAPKAALRLGTDVLEYCTKYMPKFYPFNIRGILFREAGSSMVQEAGFAFSNAIAYVEHALERGLNIDDFAARISFFFCTGTHFFEEAARLRAARSVWAKIIKDRFGTENPASMLFRCTASVGGSFYRAQEPENNLIRGAYGLLSNVLGGTQGILHPAWDEPFAIPTEESAKLALRTQQICAYETGVTKTVDPLGGSYFVEYLTESMEKEIENTIRTIDKMGGAIRAIESGYMQQSIADESYRVALQEQKGEKVVVGVNRFRDNQTSKKMHLHAFDTSILARQIDRLNVVKAERNNDAVNKAIMELKQEARGESNLIPSLVATVKTYASVGEIMEALKEVFELYQEPVVF
jgi:methylmalonyl-CoA mutase N-terminal domain/subunit